MITKIALISDIHANKEALVAVLNDIKKNECDEVINLGDCIAIGTEPAEVLNIIAESGIKSVIGNHDLYYLLGLENQKDICPEKNPGEYDHQLWTHNELGNTYRKQVSEFDSIIAKNIQDLKLVCMHYPHLIEDDNPVFSIFSKEQTTDSLRGLFAMYSGNIFVFGHNHHPCVVQDIEKSRYYINPGSLGCSQDEHAMYAVLCVENGEVRVEHRKVKYDKATFVKKMIANNPPELKFILECFHGVKI